MIEGIPVSTTRTCCERSGLKEWRTESNDDASSLPAKQQQQDDVFRTPKFSLPEEFTKLRLVDVELTELA